MGQLISDFSGHGEPVGMNAGAGEKNNSIAFLYVFAGNAVAFRIDDPESGAVHLDGVRADDVSESRGFAAAVNTAS